MSERHIVETVEYGDINIIHPADGEFFRLGALRAGDELVRDQHIANGSVYTHGSDRRRDRVGIAFDPRVRKKAPHVGGFDKRQHIDIHRSEAVRQSDRCHAAGVHRGKMDAPGVHQPSAEGQALGRVVVPADDKDPQLPSSKRAGGKLHQEIVEQLHCLGRGDRFIIYVARDQYRVRLFGIDHVQDHHKNVCLILQHGKLIHTFAQMKIGKMDQFHWILPL